MDGALPFRLDGRLPVTVVGGLHREARRATVQALLRAVPGSVALHHDLAVTGRGGVLRTVRDAVTLRGTGQAPLVNGCACCALREDLVSELLRLADDGLTRLAVVELWDSVEPQGTAEAIAAHGAERLLLTSVITAVDPSLLLPYLGNGDDLADVGLAAATGDRRTVADTWARQLEYAPVLALVDDAYPYGQGARDDQAGADRPSGRDARDGRGERHERGDGSGVESTAEGPDGGFTEDTDGTFAEGPDEGPDGSADEGHALLAQLHPTARQVRVAGAGELAAAAFGGLVEFDVEAAAARRHPASALLPQPADACGVTTYVWHRDRPCHPERLYEALEDLCCVAARSRGRFWLADRPDTLFGWDAAGGALCVESHGPWLAALPDEDWDAAPPLRRAAAALDWHPHHGDRCQHLVFTSPGLDSEPLARLLDSCLLTDAEYAAGPEAWRRFSPAFDTLLEV